MVQRHLRVLRGPVLMVSLIAGSERSWSPPPRGRGRGCRISRELALGATCGLAVHGVSREDDVGLPGDAVGGVDPHDIHAHRPDFLRPGEQGADLAAVEPGTMPVLTALIDVVVVRPPVVVRAVPRGRVGRKDVGALDDGGGDSNGCHRRGDLPLATRGPVEGVIASPHTEGVVLARRNAGGHTGDDLPWSRRTLGPGIAVRLHRERVTAAEQSGPEGIQVGADRRHHAGGEHGHGLRTQGRRSTSRPPRGRCRCGRSRRAR